MTENIKNTKRGKTGKKRGRGKKPIPRALREQVWLKTFGENFKRKCYINWCKNDINVFDFHVGHDLPESHGGSLNIKNLKPICSRCNLSMSNNYSIQEWQALNKNSKKKCRFFSCF